MPASARDVLRFRLASQLIAPAQRACIEAVVHRLAAVVRTADAAVGVRFATDIGCRSRRVADDTPRLCRGIRRYPLSTPGDEPLRVGGDRRAEDVRGRLPLVSAPEQV